MTAPALIPTSFETTGAAFTASKAYEWHKGRHSPLNPYAVEIGLPFSRKAAGDPVTMQSIQTAPGVQPVDVGLGLIDFIPEMRVSASSLSVPVQTALGSEATAVASGALKPAVTDTYSSSQLPLETIAGWIKLTTQLLDDSPMAGYSLTDPLLERVRAAEEYQIVNGSGTTPQLKGVLSTAGITAAADLPSAIGAVNSAGYRANAVVGNPNDITKLTASGPQATAWQWDPIRQVPVVYGVAVLSSIAVPAGTAIVGDWRNASMIYRRWDARIIVGHVNDDITKNLVTVVGESRLAFVITHPLGFAKFTVT